MFMDGRGRVMWLFENQHFVAILRCARKILLAYFCIGGAAIFLARLDVTTSQPTKLSKSASQVVGYIWLRTVDFQERSVA